MQIYLDESPIKLKVQTLHELSTEIKEFCEVVSEFNCGASTNIIERSFITEKQMRNYYTRISKAEFILSGLLLKRLGVFHKIKRLAFRTEVSEKDYVGKFEFENMLVEQGFVQLDYVIKSDHQKNKVMAFEFIKNVYKEFKKKKQKRLKTATNLLTLVVNKKYRRSQHDAFYQLRYAARRPNPNQYKFALKSLDKIILSCFNRRKKQAFENIIRCALQSMKPIKTKQVSVKQHSIQMNEEETSRKESSQHIYIIKPKLHSRRKSQTIVYMKVPVVAERVYLQELNLESRKKHRKSIRENREYLQRVVQKETVKRFSCGGCTCYERCKYCEMIRRFNI